MLGAERHIVLPLDLRSFGGSGLTDDIAVPKQGVGPGIPVTYVPARNTIFLSVALGWAEAAGARDLYIGVNADRKSVVWGKSVSVRVYFGGRRIIEKKKKKLT